MTGEPPSRRWLRGLIRLALVAAAVALLLAISDRAMDLAHRLESGGGAVRGTILAAGLVAYALLLAIPFVPAVEIGVSILVMRGAEMAPVAYVATVAGLMLAYLAGRYIPLPFLGRLCADLRLRRAGALIARLEALPPEARLAALGERLPRPVAALLTDWRYVTLGVLINLPGNVVLGGGGGILLIAGLSGLFRAGPVLATLLVAVLPVPAVVWVFGSGLLG
ncbi:hypothetical protein [Wenxinia marina]|uniref:TVP38/TMEM64 family membrane protein n=1 Tax=Wenxinia marina DSM 24838 TaxID=1123501 RepID=A0A0D0P8K3_9RHOB|nr:hypothetical protein [Wenxinia marina]KIQ67901.1 hypothetical protein Wenmar_03632 [Wenxinia marina DSM 24838]GGL74221.1 hypothetical protein GCM10011392_30960 [Wenxinia marina]